MLFRNHEVAFYNAIQSGAFTEKTAGEWMYMYSKDKGDDKPEWVDYFKNIDTREYKQVFVSI